MDMQWICIKSSQVVGLRDRVAIIRALLIYLFFITIFIEYDVYDDDNDESYIHTAEITKINRHVMATNGLLIVKLFRS